MTPAAVAISAAPVSSIYNPGGLLTMQRPRRIIVFRRSFRSPLATHEMQRGFMRRFLLSSLLLYSLLQAPAAAQIAHEADQVPPAVGTPFVTSYGPSDYDAQALNHMVVSDDRGVVYVANSSGILEFDGDRWELIPLFETRALVRGREGRIWVGAQDEIGYLAPDSVGRTSFVSLLEKVPSEHRRMGTVWTVEVTTDGVYFNAADRMYRWDGTHIHVIQADPPFHVSDVVRGELFVRIWGRGLVRVRGNDYELVPGGERFADTRIYALLPYDEHGILVATREEGLFLYDGGTVTPFKTEVDDRLIPGAIYLHASVLPNGHFAFATSSEGAFIIDREGRLVHHLDVHSGLSSNSVWGTYVDERGDLWLALQTGVARVELGSPFRMVGMESGLPASGHRSVVDFEGNILVGTYDGLFVKPRDKRRFERSRMDLRQVFVLRTGPDVIVSSYEGVYVVRVGDDGALSRTPVRPSRDGDYRVLDLTPSDGDDDLVFTRGPFGTGVLQRVNGRWIDRGVLDVRHNTLHLEDGTFWYTDGPGHLARATLVVPRPPAHARIDTAAVRHFGTDAGVPSGTLNIMKLGDDVVAGERGGRLVRYDPDLDRFVDDTRLQAIAAAHPMRDYWIVRDDQQRTWISQTFGPPAVLESTPDGQTVLKQGALARLAEFQISASFPQPGGDVWFVGVERFIHYVPPKDADVNPAPPVLIRGIQTDRSGQSAVVFGGGGEPPVGQFHAGITGVRIAYSSPSAGSTRQYRTQLGGLESDWSPWTVESETRYTGLPPGRYVFRVQARQAGGEPGPETSYTFSLLPPWWRSAWAYAFYGFLAVGFVLGFVRMRTQHLKARSRELAQLVEARTAELRQRVEELAVINRVQEGLVAELDMAAIYELIGEHIRTLFNAQIVVLATFDYDNNHEIIHYAIEKGRRLPSFRRPVQSVRRTLIDQKETIIIDENYADRIVEITGEPSRPVPGTEMPHSAVWVPIVRGERVTGYVSLQNIDTEHAFSDSDVRLLSTLVNSMGVALENARLYSESVQMASELTTVNEISRALAAQLHFDALIQMVGEKVRETFNAEIAYVALHDKEADMIRFVYEYGDKSEDRPFGDGITEKIILSREPLIVNRDFSDKMRELEAADIGKEPKSYLGVPIPAGGNSPAGVLSVQTLTSEAQFDDRDLHLLATIAAHVGVALQNAKAYYALEKALDELRSAQAQLVQQEKLASLGELTAGIAHEIKNPLNFINNFASLSIELSRELKEELRRGAPEADLNDLLDDLEQNAAKIEEHGCRADGIVRSMMAHARGGRAERATVRFNDLVSEYVGLAFHGKRARTPGFNVDIVQDLADDVGEVEAMPQELGRVILNLVGNAFDAVEQRSFSENGYYRPRVRVATCRANGEVQVRIEDNGPGIPPELREKILEPFFTTKPTGSGTGLGLSLSNDIVTKSHGGSLRIESEPGSGATFVVILPE